MGLGTAPPTTATPPTSPLELTTPTPPYDKYPGPNDKNEQHWTTPASHTLTPLTSTPLRWCRRISARPRASGGASASSRSNLPGRLNAGSMAPGLRMDDVSYVTLGGRAESRVALSETYALRLSICQETIFAKCSRFTYMYLLVAPTTTTWDDPSAPRKPSISVSSCAKALAPSPPPALSPSRSRLPRHPPKSQQ